MIMFSRPCSQTLNVKGSVSVGQSVSRSVLSVCVCVCPHVFSQTVAVVDTKLGYVGTCNGRSAQQVWSGVVNKSVYTSCVMI